MGMWNSCNHIPQENYKEYIYSYFQCKIELQISLSKSQFLQNADRDFSGKVVPLSHVKVTQFHGEKMVVAMGV